MSLKLLIDSGKTVFTTIDLGNILKIENKNYLLVYINRLKKRGEIKMIKKGIYVINNNFNVFELANKLRSPSYVSLQSILFKNGIIFQDYSNIITSISYNTIKINLINKEFRYHKIKSDLLSNPKGIVVENNTRLAIPERAFVDLVYIYNDYHIDNLDKLNKNLLLEIAKDFGENIFKKIKSYYA